MIPASAAPAGFEGAPAVPALSPQGSVTEKAEGRAGWRAESPWSLLRTREDPAVGASLFPVLQSHYVFLQRG